jgi:hypothetical protein
MARGERGGHSGAGGTCDGDCGLGIGFVEQGDEIAHVIADGDRRRTSRGFAGRAQVAGNAAVGRLPERDALVPEVQVCAHGVEQ